MNARLRLCAGLAVLGTLAIAGCNANSLAERTSLESAGLLRQRPGAPKGEFARIFSYYPSHEVYYSAWQDKYFWMAEHNDKMKWQSGPVLPAELALGSAEPVLVEIYASRPYTYHEVISQQYPVGYRPGFEDADLVTQAEAAESMPVEEDAPATTTTDAFATATSDAPND